MEGAIIRKDSRCRSLPANADAIHRVWATARRVPTPTSSSCLLFCELWASASYCRDKKEKFVFMTTTQKLPHWDMAVFFPGLESPEFAQAFSGFEQEISELARWFDERQIDEGSPPALSDELVQTAETAIHRLNALLKQVSTLYTYVACFVDVNSHNAVAQARLSELQNSFTQLSQLLTRFTAWIGSLDIEG